LNNKPGAVCVEEFKRHDFSIVRNARDANTIIGLGGYRASNMCPVPIVVERVAIIVDEIPTMNIVDIAIAVIIDPVTGNFARVDPHIEPSA
jgi:hypothetical protein